MPPKSPPPPKRGFSLSKLAGQDLAARNDSGAFKLPLKDIRPNPDQPRSTFNQEAHAELVDSIKQHGVLQSILVRRDEEEGYILIAGERRWRAAQEAGLEEIPARIIEATAEEAKILAVIENLQRENLTRADERRFFQELEAQHNLTHEIIGKLIGKSRSYVTKVMNEEEEPVGLHDFSIITVGSEEELPSYLTTAQLEEIKKRHPDWYHEPRYVVRVKPNMFKTLTAKLEMSLSTGFEVDEKNQAAVWQQLATLKELIINFEEKFKEIDGDRWYAKQSV